MVSPHQVPQVAPTITPAGVFTPLRLKSECLKWAAASCGVVPCVISLQRLNGGTELTLPTTIVAAVLLLGTMALIQYRRFGIFGPPWAALESQWLTLRLVQAVPCKIRLPLQSIGAIELWPQQITIRMVSGAAFQFVTRWDAGIRTATFDYLGAWLPERIELTMQDETNAFDSIGS